MWYIWFPKFKKTYKALYLFLNGKKSNGQLPVFDFVGKYPNIPQFPSPLCVSHTHMHTHLELYKITSPLIVCDLFFIFRHTWFIKTPWLHATPCFQVYQYDVITIVSQFHILWTKFDTNPENWHDPEAGTVVKEYCWPWQVKALLLMSLIRGIEEGKARDTRGNSRIRIFWVNQVRLQGLDLGSKN